MKTSHRLIRRASLPAVLLSGALLLAGCSNSSSSAHHALVGSKAYCAQLSAIGQSVNSIGQLSITMSPSAGDLSSYQSLLDAASTAASKAANLAPSAGLSNELASLGSDVSAITGNPQYLAAARGNFRAPSDLAAAAKLITQVTTDLTSVEHDNKSVCASVSLSGSLLAPSNLGG